MCSICTRSGSLSLGRDSIHPLTLAFTFGRWNRQDVELHGFLSVIWFIWYSSDCIFVVSIWLWYLCGIFVVSLWYLILVFGCFLGFQTQPARQLRWACRCETWAEHEISTVRRMPRAEDRAQDFVIAVTIRCLAGSKSRGLWSGQDQINKTNRHRLT